MKKTKLQILSILFLPLLLMSLVFGGCAKGAAKKPAPQAQNTATKKLDVTGFYVEDTGPGSSYKSLVRYNQYIDAVAPLWYTVQGDGSITDKTYKPALNFAKKNGIKVIPLVNVAKSNDIVLTNPAIRDKTIAQMIAVVKKYDLDGLNVDFEFIPDGTKDFVQDKSLMTNFMSIVSKQLRAMGKSPRISVIPHYQVTKDISGIYDYSALSPLVDEATLMLYDRHQAGSPPGPVSPHDWVESNIKNALSEGFKPEQICFGVATYGYDWPQAKAGGYSSPTKEILGKAKTRGVEVKWDAKFHEPYYVYKDPTTGLTREVWFESSHTLKEKIALAKKYNVSGICIWRLGFETPSFWDEIGKDIGTRKKK